MQTQNTPTRSNIPQAVSNLENASPLRLNQSQTSSYHNDLSQVELIMNYDQYFNRIFRSRTTCQFHIKINWTK